MTATARIPRLFQRLADVPGGAGLQVHKLLSQVLEALTLRPSAIPDMSFSRLLLEN